MVFCFWRGKLKGNYKEDGKMEKLEKWKIGKIAEETCARRAWTM